MQKTCLNLIFTFQVLRKHFFKSKTYYVKVYDDIITLGENPDDRYPKYKISLTLNNQIYWKTVVQKDKLALNEFGFFYENKVKYFCASEENLNQLRKAISGKIIFKNLEELYKVKDKLSSGSTSIVYLVEEQISKKKYAIKKIKDDFLKDQKQKVSLFYLISKDQLFEEIEIMNHLKGCENICQLIEIFEHNRTFYLVLEYLEGPTLQDLINSQQEIEINQLIHIMEQLIKGVKKIKEHFIIHGDLKPENIVFVDNLYDQLKIIDFGFGIITTKGKINFHSAGTPGYYAPEILEYKYCARTYISDLFSLGVIFFNMIQRQPLFSNNDFQKLIQENWKCQIDNKLSNVPLVFRELLQGMLQRQPKNRISIDEVEEFKIFKENFSTYVYTNQKL